MRLLLVATVLLQPAVFLPHRHVPPSLPTRQYADDMRAKNIEDILSLYTPDATFTDPDGKTFSTPDGLRQLYEQAFATYDSDVTFTVKDLNVKYADSLASSAVEADSYEEVLRTRATKTIQQVCGDCIFTWERQSDGQWLIASQRWTSKPCSAAPVI
jgi:ketosteroid isomerase-like protein